MANRLRLLFLGAGKRLSLLEQFQRAGSAEGIDLDLLAVEGSVPVPISRTATVFTGPRFLSGEFEDFLIDLCARQSIDLVVPNMDTATIALAKQKSLLARLGRRAVVSELTLCETMFDKVSAAAWFSAIHIPQPEKSGFPCIAKHRLGFGSRDQFVARDQQELDQGLACRNSNDYIIQAFVKGAEYTVDAYVARGGRLVAALSRLRREVSAGEVDVSETMHHSEILDLTRAVLAQPGWEGPITLQFIDAPSGSVIVEVNPRFGGGVTHSIHCGLDMPRWLIREFLGREIPHDVDWPDHSIMTRCRRDIFYDH
jgi:carbamoyl-phosphate synthase large subunit